MATTDTGLGDIESVSVGTREYVFHEHGVLFTAVTVCSVALSAAIAYVSFFSGATNAASDGNSIVLLILPLLIPVVLYAYYQQKVQHLFMQQLGNAIGFSYVGSASIPAGTFFGIGHGQRVSDCLSGMYKDCPMHIFSYRYTVGSGKNSHTYTDTVFQIRSIAVLPHVIMNLPDFFGTVSMEKVELEGEFNKSFTIHCEKGKQMEVREVLQPDVMAALVDSFSSYCIELSGNELYLIRRGTMAQKQMFLDAIAAVDKLFDKVIPEFSAMAAGESASVAPLSPAATTATA